jgi:hypothetical protein
MQLVDVALGDRDDPRAGEARLLVEGGDVLLVAGDSVEAFRQHDVDAAGADGVQKGLDTGAEEGGAGDGGIAEDFHDWPALTLGAVAADPNLILDGVRPLQIGTEAGIDGTTHAGLLGQGRALGGRVANGILHHSAGIGVGRVSGASGSGTSGLPSRRGPPMPRLNRSRLAEERTRFAGDVQLVKYE